MPLVVDIPVSHDMLPQTPMNGAWNMYVDVIYVSF